MLTPFINGGVTFSNGRGSLDTSTYSCKLMKRISSLLILLLLLGCGDDNPTQTEDEAPTATGGFAVAGVKEDSLYWGEMGTLTGSDFGEDTSATKLMLLFDEVEHSLITTKTIFFKVPQGAQSAKLRLFKGDSMAAGTVRLTVLPMPIGGFNSKATHFAPSTAKAGDPIVVYGMSMPLRARDYTLRIGSQPLPIDSFSGTRVFSHVPPGTKSGKIVVSMLDKVSELNIMTIIE
jgi:hypothetical protein